MSDTIEGLYEIYVSDEAIKESYEQRTVPTGRYTFAPEKAETRNLPENFKRHAGAPVISMQGRLAEPGPEGRKRGRLRFDMTWESLRKEDGKLDTISKLFNQYAVALDMRGKSVGDIRDAAEKFPVSLYIRESFKTVEGWRTPNSPEERDAFRKAGFEAKNFVDSVSKVAA